MIRHVVMWELHDAANAESFRNALLPCAQLVEGQRGYEVAVRSAGLPASVHVCLIATFDELRARQQRVAERLGVGRIVQLPHHHVSDHLASPRDSSRRVVGNNDHPWRCCSQPHRPCLKKMVTTIASKPNPSKYQVP